MDFYTENLMKSLAISFEDLVCSDGSFKFLMDVSVRGGTDYLEIAETFLDVRQTVPERVLSYDTCQEYVEASGNYRCRFLLVSLRDDYIMVFLKVVDPIGGKRRFTFHRPISLNGVKFFEDETIKALMGFECITDMIQISTEPVKTFFTDEFYNDRESAKYLFSSKIRSKRGINKYGSLFRVNFDDTPTEEIVEVVKRLEKDWGLTKFGKEINSYTLNYFKMMPSTPSVKFVTMWYQDTLVSFSLLREQASGMVRVGVSKYISVFDLDYIQNWCDCDIETATIIKKHLGDIFQYELNKHYLNDLGFSAIFYTGWNGIPSLAEYKAKYYRKRLAYYRQSLEEIL